MRVYAALCKGPGKYHMLRPLCKACSQRFCAINYYTDGKPHFRSRCDNCIRKNRGLKRRSPLWESQGYRKKSLCDRCGFRAAFGAQMLVFHLDGKLTNCDVKNLKTICQNCAVEVAKSQLPWRRGDLEPDLWSVDTEHQHCCCCLAPHQTQC